MIWRFPPAPHPVNRIPHYMGRGCFSLFFLFPFFCTQRNSLSVERPDLSSYCPLKFLQLCIFRLGICELAQSGLPICALFTFEAIIVRDQKKMLIFRKKQEG